MSLVDVLPPTGGDVTSRPFPERTSSNSEQLVGCGLTKKTFYLVRLTVND